MDQIWFWALSIGLSAVSVWIWGLFFFPFSPRFTTPTKFTGYAFIAGIVAVVASFILEKLVSGLMDFDPSFLFQTVASTVPWGFVKPLVYSFFIVALIEETTKFIFLWMIIKNKEVDQVVDGIKIGLWTGLGFASLENIFYFFGFFSLYFQTESLTDLLILLFSRGILSTMAHGLYGIIVGYYLSLARFHMLYKKHFLKTALIVGILVHGTFNFLLIYSLGIFSVILLAGILVIALIWYNDRRAVELHLAQEPLMNKPIFLAGKYEMETLLSRQKAPHELFKKLLLWYPK